MKPAAVKDLLLAPRLDRSEVSALLSPFGFRDLAKADANLQAMAGEPADRSLLAEILQELLTCVSHSANPDQALTYFERFSLAALNKTRLFSYLKDSPRALDILSRSLGGSQYMAEILIRDPLHFYWVTDPQILAGQRRKRDMQRELLQTLKLLDDEQNQLDYVRFFKRREMLHIGVRDLLRVCSVEQTLSALSVLAETLISATHWICAAALRRECGISGAAFTGFTILGMGKLGGGELNFSSDVDLMYLYASDDEEAGNGVAAPEFFRRLGLKVTAGLNDLTPEGYVYRVDLRLRPEGAGDIAYSMDAFARYYKSRLGTWERLALLKTWPVAGSRALGFAFLEMAQEFIYDRPFELKALNDVRSVKQQIDQKMRARRQNDRNVKLGTGGIREIELIAQSFQVCYGARMPEIRERNTLKALTALHEQSLISDEEYGALREAYLFLRDAENKLQMVNDSQTHSLPKEPEELATYSRLLGFASSEEFTRVYRIHTGRVHGIFESVFGPGGLQRLLSGH